MHQFSAMIPTNAYPSFESTSCGVESFAFQGMTNLPFSMPSDYSVLSLNPTTTYPVSTLDTVNYPLQPTILPPPTPNSYYQEFQPLNGEYQVNLERHPVLTHQIQLDTPLDKKIINHCDQNEKTNKEHPKKKKKLTTVKVRSRRQRAKHLIVPMELIISKLEIPRLFINVNEDDFNEMVFDNETALAFAARVGLIQNMRQCSKCSRYMALCKFNNSCGYRWVCRRTEHGRRFTCSVRGMRKNTILDDRLVGILTMLRIMFYFSHCVPDSEIFSKLDIGSVRSARTILTRLRDIVDAEISQFEGSINYTIEELRSHFFSSDKVDHFGFLLYWGIWYHPPESDGDDSDEGNAN